MSIGTFLKLDIRGASHSEKMSFSLKGFPAGFRIDDAAISSFMERRAPGRDSLSTQRCEKDCVCLKSGVSPDGVTTGGVITGEIRNEDARPLDYGSERTVPRPGHADFGQWVETGRIPTGGGKNSGRLTAPLCAAGAICLQWLGERGVSVSSRIESIRGKKSEDEMISEILSARKDGDSVGGIVVCTVKGLPPGIGGALGEGLESALSSALFSIPAVKAVEFGEAFADSLSLRGSEANDAFTVKGGILATATNRQGGIMGGRTNGSDVVFRLAVRPTPTVFVEQPSVDLSSMRPVKLRMKGRHDPCVVIRALPVVEAAVALALADVLLASFSAHPRICLTLTGKTLKECLSQFKAEQYFTDIVELRADLLDEAEREKAYLFPKMLAKAVPWKVPAILTFRKACDGGAFTGSEKTRADFFRNVFFRHVKKGAAIFSYADLEDGFEDDCLVDLIRASGAKVIRSIHSFNGPVKNVKSALRRLSRSGDVAKIAFMPRSLSDVSSLFAALKNEESSSRVVCAMGPLGFSSRVLASSLGSLWTYASVGGLENIGHVTPRELVRDYNFRSVSRATSVFGVTGYPLNKTRSPEINNAAFSAEDFDAVMVPFPSRTAKEAVSFMKAMQMKAMAVTIPHKNSIMRFLDRVDGEARKIGAVNTVVCEGDKFVGYNTDCLGFSEALTEAFGDVSDMRVAVLGDGGAAQAVKAALKKMAVEYKVFHRVTPPAGYDLLINATPVDPIPDYEFSGDEKVFDLMYFPAVTPLISRAAKAGCKVSNGFSMLVAQARAQRRHYIDAEVV